MNLVGTLGADPEVRELNSSAKVANFRLATSGIWKDRATGERKQKTEWHRFVVWGVGLVGVCEKHLRRGSKILVQGKLQTRKWRDGQGQDRYTTEVVVQGPSAIMTMLDGKPPQAEQYNRSSQFPTARIIRQGRKRLQNPLMIRCLASTTRCRSRQKNQPRLGGVRGWSLVAEGFDRSKSAHTRKC